MKLIRIKVKYYENGFAIPLLICLPLGSFLLAVGIHTESTACCIIGLIILALFLVFKIANWGLAKSEQNNAVDEVNAKIKKAYNDMLSDGISPDLAKLLLKKPIVEKYKSGEMDAGVSAKLLKYIDNQL